MDPEHEDETSTQLASRKRERDYIEQQPPEKRQKTNSFFKKIYKTPEHPLTENFWQQQELSVEFKRLEIYLETIKEDFTSTGKINFDLYTKGILDILKRNFTTSNILKNIPYSNFLSTGDHVQKSSSGCTGNEVLTLPYKNAQIVVKKFKNVTKGLEELVYSMLALEANPAPQEIKMAKIYDAFVTPESYLHIVMEKAQGNDIEHFLLMESAPEVIKASADFLATFHLAHYKGKDINLKKYINHVAKAFNTLHQPLNELLASSVSKPWLSSVESDFSTISRCLDAAQREKFFNSLKKIFQAFEETSREIYRSLQNENKEQRYYFLTVTHGDAHKNNLFYEDNILILNNTNIPKDSYLRNTMIDFSSSRRSWGSVGGPAEKGDVGDPTEDIGRLLGSLWAWSAEKMIAGSKNYEKLCGYKRIRDLQVLFIASYVHKIQESGIIMAHNINHFEEIIKKRINFYKLRYYKLLFNTPQENQDINVKLKIIDLLLQEGFEGTLVANTPLTPFPSKDGQSAHNQRRNKAECGDTNCYYLPDLPKKFVESVDKESNQSYLWRMYEYFWKGTESESEASKIMTLTGTGGVGKSSLALAYAHKVLAGHYNLVYWIPSETRSKLFKNYRNLLQDLGVSTTGAPNEKIIKLIKKHLQNKGNILLVYDNVPDSDFLNNLLPAQNNNVLHILITSRCNRGWKWRCLPVDVFQRKESVKYLLNITGLPEVEENVILANKLAEILADFPLALHHTIQYMQLQYGKPIPVNRIKEYIDILQTEYPEHFKVYQDPFKEESRALTYENLITRSLPPKKEKISTLASEILVYCAYLKPEMIEKEFFLTHLDNPKIEEALSHLCSLSLLKEVNAHSSNSTAPQSQQETVFSIHPLIQRMIRNEVESTTKLGTLHHLIRIFNNKLENNNKTKEQIKELIDDAPIFLNLLKTLLYHFNNSVYDPMPDEIKRFMWGTELLYFAEMSQDINLPNGQEKPLTQLLTFWDNSDMVAWIKMDGYFQWLNEIVQQCHPRFLYAAGRLALHEENFQTAILWLTQAATSWLTQGAEEQDIADINACLGDVYLEMFYQSHSEEDFYNALDAYAKGAQGNNQNAFNALQNLAVVEKHPEAQFKLAEIYIKSWKSEKPIDLAWAVDLYAMAAQQGHKDALARLEALAENGSKVAQSKIKKMHQEIKQKDEGAPNSPFLWVTSRASSPSAPLPISRQIKPPYINAQ